MVNQNSLKEAKEILKNTSVASIATISSTQAQPEVAVIYYYYDNVSSLYFATPSDSRKIKNIAVNNKVALTVCNVDERQELQIQGTAHIIDDPTYATSFLTSIYKVIKKDSSNVPSWPITKLHPTDLVVVRVIIKWFKYSDFTQTIPVIEGNSSDWI